MFQKGFSKIAKIVASAFAIGAVVSFGKACVQVASESQSAWIGLKSIIDGQGRSFSQAQKFINEYTKDGLIPLNNAVTAYKNLAARGYDDKQIQQVMNSLKDAAAFGRQSSYSYGEAIQSATEGLKNENSVLVDNAGVTKNVAKMWEDYAKSIGKSTAELTQQEKITAEVNGILEETKFQTGDAAKYANTFAGKTAQLSATFYQLKSAIGSVIMPIASLFIPIIQKAMNVLINFFNVIKQVMSVLGFDMSTGLNDTSKAYEQLGSGALSSAKDIDKANKKAKKSNALMNYDELNILKKNETSTSSSSGSSDSLPTGSGMSIGDAMGISGEDIISPKAKKIAENIQKAIGKVKSAFSNCKKFVSKNCKNIVAIVVAGATTITTALVGIKIASFISQISKAGGVLKVFQTAIVGLSTVFGGLSIPILAVIAAIALLTGAFVGLYVYSETFRNSVNQIAIIFGESLMGVFILFSETIIPDLMNGFSSLIDIMSPVADFVTTVFVDAWQNILQPALEYLGKTVIPTLTSVFENLWNKVLVPFSTFIGSILKPVIEILTSALEILWKNVGLPLADFLGGIFTSAFEGVTEVLTKTVIPIFEKVISICQFLWDNVLSPIVDFLWKNFKPAFEIVCKSIGDIFGGLKQIFQGVIDFVTVIFSGNWEKAWNGIKDIFSGIWDTIGTVIKTPLNLILSGIESLINTLIDGFNSFKKAINKISFEIPSWVPVIGGKKWGFNLKLSDPIKLDPLAQGGWVEPNKPRPVIVGDNKHEGEIIAPESKIYGQTYKAAIDAIKDSLINNMSGCDQQHLKFTITLVHQYPDGKYMIQEINDTQIKEGKITLLT